MEQRVATVKYSSGFSTLPDFERFNTCKHRSPTKEDYTIKTCCQQRQENGWVCYKIPLYGLTANHCRDCPVYEKKEV